MTAFRLAIAALVLTATAAFAQQAQTVRIRGQIDKIDGNMLTVKARDGGNVAVRLADDVRVLAQVKASANDIKPGAFIGITGVPQPDGNLKAVAIHFFLDSQRGVVADRHGPWDLLPNATMTNAYVETSVAGVNGREVLVKYKDGEKKVIVTPETQIVRNATAERSEVKAGAQIIIFGAQKQPDGSLVAPAIYVGRDGVTPPM